MIYSSQTAYGVSRIFGIVFLALFYGLLYLVLDDGTFQGLASRFGGILAPMGFAGLLSFTLGHPGVHAHAPSVLP